MYFLISTTVLIVLATGLCGYACFEVLNSSGKGISALNLIKTLFDMPFVVISLVALAFGFFSISPLLTYHIYLIAIGETTNENVRDVFEKEENVFNQGWYRNFKHALFSEKTPSALPDMTEVISASDYMHTIRREREEAAI